MSFGDGQPVNAEWDHALRPTPIDWEDPLSAQHFAAWHSAQANKHDTVSESTGAVTLTTVPSADVPVLLASLTVRQSDWHPIAERVALRGGPAVEVSELAYEVRDVASLDVAEAPAARARNQQRMLTNQRGKERSHGSAH